MEAISPYLVIGGFALVVVSYIWLVALAYIRSTKSGVIATIFFPFAYFSGLRHWKTGRWPLAVFVLGIVSAGFPPIYSRLTPVDLGPRERIVNGELHVTLTGWDKTDYSILTRKPEIVVLQMANSDVNDTTIGYLKNMKKLRDLDLNHTAVTDACLPVLASLPALEGVKLSQTKVTDEGFSKSLMQSASLKNLDLRGTQVSKDVGHEWRDAKPGRRVMQ